MKTNCRRKNSESTEKKSKQRVGGSREGYKTRTEKIYRENKEEKARNMKMKKKKNVRIKINIKAMGKQTYEHICRRSGMKAVFWDVVHCRK